jgi:hypothetical protein
MNFDVFNGDADGLCALLQLRLHRPLESTLITGVKRDIQLLRRVSAKSGDEVTVLDVSLDKNIDALQRVLTEGASVFYVDHHQAKNIPSHPHLTALINTDANICTSLLVDQHLEGRFRAWAVTAAFGDNMTRSAMEAAKSLVINEAQLKILDELGVCLNYNGYGGSLDDLHFSPEILFQEMLPFASPFDFIEGNKSLYEALKSGYYEDMLKAKELKAEYLNSSVAVFLLPDDIWSRRVSGVFGNYLANKFPNRAHAVLSCNEGSSYTVSVRAPLVNKTGADLLCGSFPSGGGRKAAAGINRLPVIELGRFISRFSAQYSGK